MFQHDVCSAPAASGARRLLRRVCTSNPFYVVSALLFLAGLRISFGRQADAIETWALMGGLAGYTLLLAVTACLLVRFAQVWDDMRTVLLLVVLMFLATSVTFDELLVLDPDRGFACVVGGLLFAVAVSEELLHVIQLELRAGFRLPYYLILSLFFLYPLGLSPLVEAPHSEVLMWGLFGFATAAGLAFLTLLPAIARGPAYVRDNGSPWPWPWYPWTLFGVLAFAVPARAFLLCWSMHLLENADSGNLIFGPYFLVPFGLVLATLLLHIGLQARREGAVQVALLLPGGLVVLALVGHRDAAIYREFLGLVNARLGAGPLYLTLVGISGFYGYAAWRRLPTALEAMTLAVVAVALVPPHGLGFGGPIRPEPILAAAALQLAAGLWRREPIRGLVGAVCLAALGAFVVPEWLITPVPRPAIAFHLVLVTLFAVGAGARNRLGRILRDTAAVAALAGCLAAMFLRWPWFSGLEPWMVQAYPLAMTVLLLAYGVAFDHRVSIQAASLIASCWLARLGSVGYGWLRHGVAGLDYLAISLAVFVLAIAVSLSKSRVVRRLVWEKARTRAETT